MGNSCWRNFQFQLSLCLLERGEEVLRLDNRRPFLIWSLGILTRCDYLSGWNSHPIGNIVIYDFLYSVGAKLSVGIFWACDTYGFRRFDEKVILFAELLLHISSPHELTSCSRNLPFNYGLKRCHPWGFLIRILNSSRQLRLMFSMRKLPQLLLIRISGECYSFSFGDKHSLELSWLIHVDLKLIGELFFIGEIGSLRLGVRDTDVESIIIWYLIFGQV